MSVVTLVRTSLSPAVARLQSPRPARETRRHRPVHVDGRGPARLVAAPYPRRAQTCAPQPVARSLGWLVLVGLASFAVVLGVMWTGGGASVPASTVSVTVHPGETLWSVAQRMAPGVPVSDEMAKIRQLNGLDVDSVLYPGELLTVPSAH